MADDIKVNASVDVSAPAVATDDVGGKHYQKIKVTWGPDNTVNETDDASGKRVPINVAESALIGAVNETAPATDTASSGLNGRLQRVAQRITSLIALVPASLGQKASAASFAAVLSTEQEGLIGALTETAPATDTASSGLNGRLQRIAQRLTSVIALLPTALTALGGLKTGPAEGTATVTVTSGQTESAQVDTAGMRNMGLIVPSTFDGTTITFKVSNTSGGTDYPLYDALNTQVSMTVAASRAYDLPGELMAWRYIKIVCGTSQTTTNTDFVLVYRS